jgi:hypothetical protein
MDVIKIHSSTILTTFFNSNVFNRLGGGVDLSPSIDLDALTSTHSLSAGRIGGRIGGRGHVTRLLI